MNLLLEKSDSHINTNNIWIPDYEDDCLDLCWDCIQSSKCINNCNSPLCGFMLTEYREEEAKWNLSVVLESIMKDLQNDLLQQQSNTYNFLINTKGYHPEVIEEAFIGTIPENYNVDSSFEPLISYLESRLAIIKHKNADTTRTDNIENAIAEAKKIRDGLQLFIDLIPFAMVFGYTDVSLRIISFRFLDLKKRQYYIFPPFKKAGVFGNNFYMPTNDYAFPPYYDDLFVVHGEFDLLRLQTMQKNTGSPFFLLACAMGSGDVQDFEVIEELSLTRTFIIEDKGHADRWVNNIKCNLKVFDYTLLPDYQSFDSYIRLSGSDAKRELQQVRSLFRGVKRVK